MKINILFLLFGLYWASGFTQFNLYHQDLWAEQSRYREFGVREIKVFKFENEREPEEGDVPAKIISVDDRGWISQEINRDDVGRVDTGRFERNDIGLAIFEYWVTDSGDTLIRNQYRYNDDHLLLSVSSKSHQNSFGDKYIYKDSVPPFPRGEQAFRKEIWFSESQADGKERQVIYNHPFSDQNPSSDLETTSEYLFLKDGKPTRRLYYSPGQGTQYYNYEYDKKGRLAHLSSEGWIGNWDIYYQYDRSGLLGRKVTKHSSLSLGNDHDEYLIYQYEFR